MARYTVTTLAQHINLQSPSECCLKWEQCCDGFADWQAKPENHPDCKSKPSQKARPLPTLVRIGRDPDRTEGNPQGGGRKTWYPSASGWYTLASLEEEIAGCDLPEGVYRVVYGEAGEAQISEPLPLTLEWAEGGTRTASGTQDPGPKQQHYDQLHKTHLRRLEIDNAAAEGSAATGREGLKAGLDALKDAKELLTVALNTSTQLLEGAKHQIEAAGMLSQAAREASKKIALAALSAEPEKPFAVQMIEAATAAAEVIIPKVGDAMAKRQLAAKMEVKENLPTGNRILLADGGVGEGTGKKDTDLPFAVRIARD